MPLNQQMKETSKWNTPLYSCAAQVQEQYQKITCNNLGWQKYCCWPLLSADENYLHSWNITRGGGHKRYKCRSIDLDYQSNCITVTVFISTYLFHHVSFICTKPKSAVYGTEQSITTGQLAFPFSRPLTHVYGGLSPSIS